MNKTAVLELVSKKFDKLTVIKRVENSKWRESQWLCQCECGNERVVTGHALTRGCVKSCKPCKIKKKRLPPGEAGFNRLWYDVQYNAKQRNKKFSLTKDQVRDITGQDCHYCGDMPSQIKKTEQIHINGHYIANGIDRVDNDRGYHIDNVVSCCEPCNIAKSTMTYNEFKVMIARIYHHLKLH